MDSTTKRKITLAGRTFEISCLPFKKNRMVVPAASFALNAINRSQSPTNEPLNITAIDNIYLAVYEAISHSDPSITREQFNEWGCFLPDLIAALMIVALQTGVLIQTDGKAGEAKAGEQ